jgi:predicted amidohydrolase
MMSGARRATTVACCQVSLRVGALEANREACRRAAERAAGDGAQIIVLPELAASGYVFASQEEARALAEPVSGPTVTGWTELAERTGTTIVGGICELGADGKLYNTAVVVDGAQVRAAYRKAHLWDKEKAVFTPGSEEPPVVDVGEARLAVMVCYDLEFPEWVRIPALAGAQLLCVPTNWPSFPRPAGERPMEVVRAQAAASVNRMYVAACDRAGPERGVDWVGGSVILDPDGWPLAGPLDDQEGTIMAACQLETATDKKISEHNDVLGDRQPGLYHRVLGESRQAREGGSR